MKPIQLDAVDLFRVVAALRTDESFQSTYLANKIEALLKQQLRESLFIRQSELGHFVAELGNEISTQ